MSVNIRKVKTGGYRTCTYVYCNGGCSQERYIPPQTRYSVVSDGKLIDSFLHLNLAKKAARRVEADLQETR